MTTYTPKKFSWQTVGKYESKEMAVERSRWPKDVHGITLGELVRLGVDSQNKLYWDGKPIKTGLQLAWPEKTIAAVIAIATVFGAFGACVQAWAAYQDWACKTQLPGAASAKPST